MTVSSGERFRPAAAFDKDGVTNARGTVRRGLAVAEAPGRLPPKLKINLEIDVGAFEREVDTHMLNAFRPAIVDALNAAGEAAVDAV